MEVRLRLGDISLTHPQQFQQHFETRTTAPLELCMHPKFLMDVRHMLQIGDRINVVRYRGPWQEVIGIMEGLRVLTNDSAGVALSPPVWMWVPEPEEAHGIEITRGIRGHFVVRVFGEIEKQFTTRLEAQQYAKDRAEETDLPWVDNSSVTPEAA